MMNPPESDLAPCQTCGGSGTQPIGERWSRHDPIPALPGEKGRSYLCKDSDGNWYYLNHAREWHTCPAPGASTTRWPGCGSAPMADRAPPGEQRWSRSISHRYTTLNMLTEQADHLLRRNYAAENWSIDALKLQCARQAAMIEALAGKNARQRLELRRLNRALARKARAKKDRPDV